MMDSNRPFVFALLASGAIAAALMYLPRLATHPAPAPVSNAEAAEAAQIEGPGWRGFRHQTKGEWAQAAADYREALRREPDLGDVPINLAQVYEKMRKPCEAQRTLRALFERYPRVRVTDDVVSLWKRVQNECTRAIPARALRVEQ